MSIKLPTPTVVVFVSDVRRVSAFYRELAAMRVVEDEETHAVMEIDGFQLVIHASSAKSKAPRDGNGHVPVREDSCVKLCLPVASIAAARSVAVAHGGAIKPSEKEWESRGFRACDGYDPEGNVIQVREIAPTPS